MAETDSKWDGEEYLSKPGALETGSINATTLLQALERRGLSLSTTHAIEVGAGAGTVTPHLTALASVHAIEPSESMAAALSTRVAGLPNVTFAVTALSPDSAASFAAGEPKPSPTREDPGRVLPPPRARFDAAFSTLVAHHVSDLPGFFAGIHGVLSPGGILVIIEFALSPEGEDLSRKFHVEMDARLNPIEDDDQTFASDFDFRTTWTMDHLKRLLEQHGFVYVEVQHGNPIPPFGNGPVPTTVATARKP